MLDSLFSASFKGVSFLVKSASTTGGRKQVKHEYPNSAKQRIEDLGFQPRNFKMSCVIVAGPGKTYQQTRDALLAALEEGGVGTLSHPFFSASLEVTARPYTLDESMSSLGRGDISLEFDYSSEKTDPRPVSTSIPTLNKKRNNVFSAIKDDLAANFEASFPVNFTAAKTMVTDFTSQLADAVSSATQFPSTVNSFASELSGFTGQINTLILDPVSFASSITQLIGNSTGIFSTTAGALGVFQRMFTYGDEYKPVNPTTVLRIQKNTNQQAMKNGVQIAYLAAAYQTSAQRVYTTVDEIEAIQSLMDAQYVKTIGNSPSQAIIYLLTDLRAESNKFLEAQRLTAAQVVTEEVGMQSMALSAFSFYGYDDNLVAMTTSLVDLNRPLSDDVSFVGGEIEVLTE